MITQKRRDHDDETFYVVEYSHFGLFWTEIESNEDGGFSRRFKFADHAKVYIEERIKSHRSIVSIRTVWDGIYSD